METSTTSVDVKPILFRKTLVCQSDDNCIPSCFVCVVDEPRKALKEYLGVYKGGEELAFACSSCLSLGLENYCRQDVILDAKQLTVWPRSL